MTLKRRLWTYYVNILKFPFLRKEIKQTLHFNCDIKQDNYVCIITIAFDNEFLIEQQIRLVKKYIEDKNYIYVIADNSPTSTKRKLIQSICKGEKVGYISLPQNPFNSLHKKPSYSHGLSMTWMYNNFIKLMKPTVFGFIDHDLFPISPYSVFERINNQDFFGRMIDREKGWYLWAGFCFFNYKKTETYKLNFLPYKVENVYLDTGGSNFPVLYSKYQKEDFAFCKPVVEKSIREGNCYHSDFVHFIDESWLHTINGSNWAKVDSKENILKELLNEY